MASVVQRNKPFHQASIIYNGMCFDFINIMLFLKEREREKKPRSSGIS